MISKLNYVDIINGQFAQTSRADLREAFVNATSRASRKIVIHCHGGLVGREDGLLRGESLCPFYTGLAAYPIFCIWNSDLPTVLTRNLRQIAKESLFWAVASRVNWLIGSRIPRAKGTKSGTLRLGPLAPVSVADAADSIATAADHLENQLDGVTTSEFTADDQAVAIRLLERDTILQTTLAAMRAADPQIAIESQRLVGPDEVATLMSRRVQEQLRLAGIPRGNKSVLATAQIALSIVQIAIKVVRRLRQGRDHGRQLICAPGVRNPHMSLYATTPHPNPENTRQRSKKSCSQSDASRQPYAPAAAPVLIGAKYARPFSQALRGLGCLGIPASSVLPPLQ